MTKPTNTDSDKTDSAGAAASKGLNVLKLIAIAFSIVVVGGSIAAGVWYVQSQEPALHRVHGVVLLDGQPMKGGAIMTVYRESSDWSGALAGVNDDGTFEMTTNGAMGAYEGEHAVTFALMDGGFPPTSLLPGKYIDPRNPPFIIQVNPNLEAQKFELVGKLEGPKPRESRGEKEADEKSSNSEAGEQPVE